MEVYPPFPRDRHKGYKSTAIRRQLVSKSAHSLKNGKVFANQGPSGKTFWGKACSPFAVDLNIFVCAFRRTRTWLDELADHARIHDGPYSRRLLAALADEMLADVESPQEPDFERVIWEFRRRGRKMRIAELNDAGLW